MKGLIRIGGALGIGIIIIAGALYMKNARGTEASGELVVVPAPPRSYIEARDSNGDGVKDWQQNLEANAFKTITTPPSTATNPDSEDYIPPTTFTGKFSEAFFQDYMNGKMKGTDFTDPAQFVGDAVSAIEKNTASKRHTPLEITIVPTSPETIRAYGNRISEIIQTHSIENENEAVILQKALEANDPKMLEPLEPIRKVYVNIIADTLRVEVPESLVNTHIALLNSYEAILTDIGAMQIAFTDPLYSLARIKGYRDDADTLISVFQSIQKIFKESDVFYTSDEPGAWFYNFEK